MSARRKARTIQGAAVFVSGTSVNGRWGMDHSLREPQAKPTTTATATIARIL
jgi:hypothetical protein